MISDFKTWRDAALGKGLTIEHDGSGKIVAHADGVEKGIYDPGYGGSGAGWFNEEAK
jgi:hypothetical protein